MGAVQELGVCPIEHTDDPVRCCWRQTKRQQRPQEVSCCGCAQLRHRPAAKTAAAAKSPAPLSLYAHEIFPTLNSAKYCDRIHQCSSLTSITIASNFVHLLASTDVCNTQVQVINQTRGFAKVEISRTDTKQLESTLRLLEL